MKKNISKKIYIHEAKYISRAQYKNLVGGAVAMRKEVFEHINGYTNTFYGWGGEDDNLAARYIYIPIICLLFFIHCSHITG